MATFFVQHRKWVALCILALGGWAAALSSFFAKRPGAVTIVEEPIIWRDTALEPAAVYPPTTPTPGAQGPVAQVPSAAVAAAVPGDPLAGPVPRPTDEAPPALEAAYPNQQPPAPSHAIPPSAMRTARLQAPADSTAAPGDAPGTRRHEVRDGDTLEGLAQHYLGDPSRVADIIAINRDQLPNPDLLPIGLELRIPPAGRQPDRSVVPAGLADAGAPAATTMIAVPEGSLRRDVASATLDFAPLPTATATTPGTRKHRVRQGDTLRSIARHYYGDAQRFGEIFAANQATLRDADLLPVGTELIVP
ncbi:MAG: LysM peptidoglycan-binding domain-containing protein [Pirellulales bacterium]|nr:LysM peptidoglycan-binding domain-containing protein [Pirellulales bacterium]